MRERVGERVALGELLGRAAHQRFHRCAPCQFAVGAGQVAHAGLGDRPRCRRTRGSPSIAPGAPGGRLRAAGRPQREVSARRSGRACSRARGRAARRAVRGGRSPPPRRRTSRGQPPPLPTRRYSMFQTAQPAPHAASPRERAHHDPAVAPLPRAAVDEHRSPGAGRRREADAAQSAASDRSRSRASGRARATGRARGSQHVRVRSPGAGGRV